jgi:CRISPR-associated endonuclease Cas2
MKKNIKNKKEENRKSRLAGTIAKKVLENSYNVSALIFSAFFQMGEITMNSFLSPSLYADMPKSFYDPVEMNHKNKSKIKEITIRQSIRRLQKQGFVKKEKSKYKLTAKGLEIANYIFNRKKEINKKWDGKYRVVIFDIPEKQSEARNWLRQELYLLNYKKLQESVFISRYSLTKDLIKEIKSNKIGNCVNYLLVDKIYKNIF